MTCRPGTSVLVTVVKRPIWPAHAAARRRGRLPTSPVDLTYARASPTFGQFITDADEVRYFVVAFDQAVRVALTPAESVSFIENLADEWEAKR